MTLSHDEPSHPTIIAETLLDLKRDPTSRPNDYRLLAGGLSGSFVYAFHLAGERVVLKVTLPASTPALLHQARREAAFYQRLAPDIPLAVPRLLAASPSIAQGVAILLAADRPAPPLPSWTDRHYTEIATQLGQLHGRFWGKADRLRTFRWLRPGVPPALSVRCQQARLAWRVISNRDDLGDSETQRHLRAVPGLVTRLPGIVPPPPLPDTLCHGDCHPENLLWRGMGEWIWADWQAVRTGQGPEDLTFFWQRAEMAGGDVPREAMLTAYRAGLAIEGAEAPTARQLEQALSWAEFRSWLLDWPPYLAGASASRLGVVLDRIDDLAGRLEIGRTD